MDCNAYLLLRSDYYPICYYRTITILNATVTTERPQNVNVCKNAFHPIRYYRMITIPFATTDDYRTNTSTRMTLILVAIIDANYLDLSLLPYDDHNPNYTTTTGRIHLQP